MLKVNLKEERLYKSQKDLELLQRVEEDHLMQSFRQKRQEEATSIKQEVDEEWQERLKQLTDKYTKSRKNRNKTAGAVRSKATLDRSIIIVFVIIISMVTFRIGVINCIKAFSGHHYQQQLQLHCPLFIYLFIYL